MKKERLSQWISVKDKAAAKDKPILVHGEFLDFPVTVLWKEDGTYGDPGFFENGDEYSVKESDISHWMYCPEKPEYQHADMNDQEKRQAFETLVRLKENDPITRAVQDPLLEKAVSEIVGRERKIVDDFCKAFIAQKSLEGFDPKFLFDNLVLNVHHDFKEGSKYWFSYKTDPHAEDINSSQENADTNSEQQC